MSGTEANAPQTGFLHPADMIYIKVGAVLAVMTGIEIVLPIIFDGKGHVYGPPLIVLMLLKFLVVAGFFMHLRWDSPLLRRTFYFGAIWAVFIYGCVLTSMTFWVDSGLEPATRSPDTMQQQVIPAAEIDAANGNG